MVAGEQHEHGLASFPGRKLRRPLSARVNGTHSLALDDDRSSPELQANAPPGNPQDRHERGHVANEHLVRGQVTREGEGRERRDTAWWSKNTHDRTWHPQDSSDATRTSTRSSRSEVLFRERRPHDISKTREECVSSSTTAEDIYHENESRGGTAAKQAECDTVSPSTDGKNRCARLDHRVLPRYLRR